MLWLPADEPEPTARTCLEWCAERGYEVVGMVVDDGRPGLWRDVREMLMEGAADVLVAPRWRDLPTDRRPRVEAVDCWEPPPSRPVEPEPPGQVRPLRRRPRPMS